MKRVLFCSLLVTSAAMAQIGLPQRTGPAREAGADLKSVFVRIPCAVADSEGITASLLIPRQPRFLPTPLR